MKKLLYCAAALVMLLMAGSCQKENLSPERGGKTVTFTVSAPSQIETKTIGDGLNVNELYYAVYKTDPNQDHSIDDSGTIDGPLATGMVGMEKKNVALPGGTESADRMTATVELDLVKSQNFTIIFWAQVSNGYYDLTDLRKIKINEDNSVAGNDESRAAFYATYKFNTDVNKVHDVILKRPFAQLNLGTTLESLKPVLDGSNGYEIKVIESEVKVKGLSSVFDTVNEKAIAETSDRDFTFVMKKTPYQQDKEVLMVQNKEFHYVSMNYFFVPNAEKLVELSYTIKTDKGDIENSIINVPVKQNYRTNIIGNLLTTNTKFEIVVDKDFNQPDIDLKYEADGIIQVNPDLNADPKSYVRKYEISSVNGFQYAMNEIVPVLDGKVGEEIELYLLQTIDMATEEYVSAKVPGGAKVLLATGPATKASGEIVIKGLKTPIFDVVEEGATVTFLGVVVEDYAGEDAAFVKVNNGTVNISTNCSAEDSAAEDVEFIGSGYAPIEVDEKGYLPVANADDLIYGLENNYDVSFTENIKIDPANMSSAYGKTGINVKNGQAIYGNGKTLDIKGAGGTWDSGISTTGGLIKDLTVTGSFRGIFINHNSTYSEPVVLDNVTLEGVTYTISCDQGMNQNFEAYNSTFKGWTSYAATLGDAKFTDCYFGEGNGYSYCRPYAPTEFVNCTFEVGYKMDPRAEVTFENCTIGDVALTVENLSTLVSSMDKVSSVNGVDQVDPGCWKDNNGNVTVTSSVGVTTALKANVENIKLLSGEYDVDLYSISERETLTITGSEGTKVAFKNLQVRASQFRNLTIDNCEILRMPDKAWGHLVFGSGNKADGVYTVSNCTFNGVGSQGIFINETVSGATYNILNCTFNGDFGGEGAVTIQNNDNVNHTVNVTGCTFNNIPDTSHEIYIHYAYDGWKLNAEGVDAYWTALQ